MPLIRAGGRRVHIQELGDTGPRVVLAHPLGSSVSAWYFTVAPLLARSFRVLLYDIRGHGLTEFATEGYDLATLAGDMRDVLEEWLGPEPEPIRVGGHSSGGALVLRFALDHPAWVHSLAVVDAPVPPYSVRESEALGDMDPEEALAKFPKEEQEVRRGARRRTKALNRQIRLRNESTFTSDFESEPSFLPDLAGLTTPTLLLYGTRSPFRPTGDILHRRIPGSVLETMEGGHMLPLERRSEVASHMADFFG